MILFLAANPVGTTPLALTEECAAIERELKATPGRDDFEFRTGWAVSVDDIMRHLLEHEPTIIHFSGHGTANGLVVVGDDGAPHEIPHDALTQMIAAAADQARLVVLNACYSDLQAEALCETIGHVIGMRATIDDAAARSFAVAFYRALGHRRSVAKAFQHGVATLAAKRLKKRAEPRYLVRAGEPGDLYLTEFGPSSATAPEPAKPHQEPSSGVSLASGERTDVATLGQRLERIGNEDLFEKILVKASSVDRSLFAGTAASLAARINGVVELAKVHEELRLELHKILDQHAPWTKASGAQGPAAARARAATGAAKGEAPAGSAAGGADRAGAETDRRRAEAARTKVRTWLETQLLGHAPAAEALRDELARDVSVTGLGVADAALPGAVTTAILDGGPGLVVAALSAAHRRTAGESRRVIEAILFRVVSFLGEFDQLRTAAVAGGDEVVLPVGTRTLAEIVSAGIDELPADLIPNALFPVGRAAVEVQPEMLVPLVPLQRSGPDAGPLTDHAAAFVDGLVVAVCNYSGEGRERFEEIRKLFDGATDRARENRRAAVQQVLEHVTRLTGRTRYLLFVDDALVSHAPELDRMWRVIGGLVKDPRTGMPALRLVRMTAQPSEVQSELGIALHIADVTTRARTAD